LFEGFVGLDVCVGCRSVLTGHLVKLRRGNPEPDQHIADRGPRNIDLAAAIVKKLIDRREQPNVAAMRTRHLIDQMTPAL
jgi:hypothetical protein